MKKLIGDEKVVQIETVVIETSIGMYALTDRGNIFFTHLNSDDAVEWQELPGIPKD